MSLPPRENNKSSSSLMGSHSHPFRTPEKCRIPDHLNFPIKGVTDSPFGEFCANGLPDLLTPTRGKHGAGICDGASLGIGQLGFSNTPGRRQELNQVAGCLRTPDRDQGFFHSAVGMSTPVHRHPAGYDLDTLLGTPSAADFPAGLRALMGQSGDATPSDCAELYLFANSPFSNLKAPTPKKVLTSSQPLAVPECGVNAHISLQAAGQEDLAATFSSAIEGGQDRGGSCEVQLRSAVPAARNRQSTETRRRGSSSRRLDFTGAVATDGLPKENALPTSGEPIPEEAQKHSTPVPPTPVQEPASAVVSTPTQSSTAHTPVADHLAKTFGADPEVLRQHLGAHAFSTDPEALRQHLNTKAFGADSEILKKQLRAVAAGQSAGSVEQMQALMQSVYAAGMNLAGKSPVVSPHTPPDGQTSAVDVKADPAAPGKVLAGGDPNEPRKHCNCKNSKCLKLYCDCFKLSLYCDGCSCKDCKNTEVNADLVKSTMEQIKQRDPEAFEQKIAGTGKGQHRKGCNCKKSHCRKKYCECFQAGVPCGEMCKCANCENMEKSATKGATQKTSKARGKSSSRLDDKEISGAEILPASKLDMGLSNIETAKDIRRRPQATANSLSAAETLKLQIFGGQDSGPNMGAPIPDADTIARTVAASKPLMSNRPTTRSLSIGHKRPNSTSSDSDSSKFLRREPGLDRQPSHKVILGDICCLSPASSGQQPPRLCSPQARSSPVTSLLSAGHDP